MSARRYQRVMHEERGVFATWLPGDRIELGDLGVLEEGRFRKMASLKELKIEQEAGKHGSPQTVRFSSNVEQELSAGARVDAAGKAGGEIKFKFASEGSCVFHALDLREKRLENRVRLGKDAIASVDGGDWQLEWLLVESVYEASYATILVAEGESAELVLGTHANLAAESLCLADPKLELHFRSQKGTIEQVIAAKGARPLYSCLRIGSSWFSGKKLKPVRGQSPDVIFERVPLTALVGRG